MIPTVQNVYSRARGILGDRRDEVFHNSVLESYLDTAYSELFAVLDRYNVKLTEREAHYNLPAYTTQLTPATFGADNFGEPIDIRERSVATTNPITGVTTPSPTDATVTLQNNHAFADGQAVIVTGVQGLSDDINDEWAVVVSGLAANQVKLMGATSTGAYTSGGVLSTSNEPWSDPLVPVRGGFDYRAPSSRHTGYEWKRDRFTFAPVTQDRQLRIRYSLSAAAPVKPTASLGVDDSLRFLAYRVAGLAGHEKGHEKADEFTRMAVGIDGEADGSGGYLKELVHLGVQQLQNETFVPLRFRRRRTSGYKRRGEFFIASR